MAWLDTLIIVLLLTFIGLLVWSRVQHQTMLDTIKEIKQIFKEIGKK